MSCSQQFNITDFDEGMKMATRQLLFAAVAGLPLMACGNGYPGGKGGNFGHDPVATGAVGGALIGGGAGVIASPQAPVQGGALGALLGGAAGALAGSLGAQGHGGGYYQPGYRHPQPGPQDYYFDPRSGYYMPRGRGWCGTGPC